MMHQPLQVQTLSHAVTVFIQEETGFPASTNLFQQWPLTLDLILKSDQISNIDV
jgi:hypothetical protein